MSPYESPSCLLYWSQLDKPICCWVKEVHIIIKCLSGFKHQQLHNDLKSRCIVLQRLELLEVITYLRRVLEILMRFRTFVWEKLDFVKIS